MLYGMLKTGYCPARATSVIQSTAVAAVEVVAVAPSPFTTNSFVFYGPLFHLFSSFQTNIFLQILTANKCEKLSIQYTLLEFKPTTFVN